MTTTTTTTTSKYTEPLGYTALITQSFPGTYAGTEALHLLGWSARVAGEGRTHTRARYARSSRSGDTVTRLATVLHAWGWTARAAETCEGNPVSLFSLLPASTACFYPLSLTRSRYLSVSLFLCAPSILVRFHRAERPRTGPTFTDVSFLENRSERKILECTRVIHTHNPCFRICRSHDRSVRTIARTSGSKLRSCVRCGAATLLRDDFAPWPKRGSQT